MSAFYLADLINSDGIETDIRKTKDNKLVLIHDKTINRTSNANGKVSDYTYGELLNIDFGNKNYKGEKIVTLDDFLKFFSDKKIKIYLEIKERGYEDLIIESMLKYNYNNITLISFKYDILKNIRSKMNDIKIGWLLYNLNDIVVTEAEKIKIDELLFNCFSLDNRNVKFIKQNNFIIGAWGVKNVAEIKRMEKLGIDVIICDSSYDAKKVLQEDKYE